MSIISSVANYGGRQPNNTSFIKQFVQSTTSLVEWIFVTSGATTYIEPSITNKDIYIPQSMIVDGNLTVNGVFNNPSDERLKDNIQSLEHEYNYCLRDDLPGRLMDLRPVSYVFKHDTAAEPTRRYGLIAQEVEKLFPELVSKPASEEEMKAVNYIELVPILLAQIQQMQYVINDLTSKTRDLEDTVDRLERRLDRRNY